MCESGPSNSDQLQQKYSENCFEKTPQVPAAPDHEDDYVKGYASSHEDETYETFDDNGDDDDDHDDRSKETMHDQQTSIDTNIPTQCPRAMDLLMSVSVSTSQYKIAQLSIDAKEELIKLATQGEPLWNHEDSSGGHNRDKLNELEYRRRFVLVNDSSSLQRVLRLLEAEEANIPTLGLTNMNGGFFDGVDATNNEGYEPLQVEASRETKFFPIDSVDLVEQLMDVKQWLLTFGNIVSNAALLGVWKPDIEPIYVGGSQVDYEVSCPSKATTYDGMLQVLSAEFHMPTAFVPHRQCHFARYCKRVKYCSWVVVDVSLESLFPYPKVDLRRRPSGCLIEGSLCGTTRVTWVEHVEVSTSINYPMFDSIIKFGFAFDAKRWMTCIKQYCDVQAALIAPHSISSPVACIEGRNSLLKLSNRMVTSFYAEICASSSNIWMPLPGAVDENIQIRMQSIFSPLMGPEDQLVITASFLLGVPPERVFAFLRNANSRNQWDILARGNFVVELCHLVLDEKDPRNQIQLIDVRNGNTHKREIIYLQQSIVEESVSYLVYAPMNEDAVSNILHGGLQDTVRILASGFAVFPDWSPANENNNSVVTMTLNIISQYSLQTQDMIQTISRIVNTIAGSIANALSSGKSLKWEAVPLDEPNVIQSKAIRSKATSPTDREIINLYNRQETL
ncbi:hypothetical protein ACFE04_024369 [Oxalis oulophora]